MAKPNISSIHFSGLKLRVGQGNKVNKGNGDPIMTLGYLEGTNICDANGNWGITVYRVEVNSTTGKKTWIGRIVARFNDQWIFTVVNTKNEADPETENAAVTVTVTNPTLPAGEQTGTSQPQSVPLEQIP